MAVVDKPNFPEYLPTLPNVIGHSVAKFAHREFLVEGDKRWTYRQIEERSARLALGLVALGVGKASRVAIIMPNCTDWVVAWWAAGRIGAFTVPLSTFFRPRELAWALRQADIETLLIHRSFLNSDYVEHLESAIPELTQQHSTLLYLQSHPCLRHIVVWGECDRPWAMRGPDDLHHLASSDARIGSGLLERIEETVVPADLLIGICTSGSTAEPKIVVHTHGNVIRICHAYRAYIMVRPDERNYSGMPFFWLGGLNYNLLQVMFEGACMVFSPTPRPGDVLDTVCRERVTRISLWPAQQSALLENARSRGVDLSFVQRGLFEPRDGAGEIIPAARRSTLLGMTESFGPHGVASRDDAVPEERSGSAGRTLQGIDRRIVDPETGATLPPGQVGELYIRGFSMMQGYYKRERSDVFDRDGFFATGDLCIIDEAGYIYYQSRRTEMIKTAGANVAPMEIEALLQGYENVQEAIVFGLPDVLKGERVTAVLVAKEGKGLDVAKVHERLKNELSPYKLPGEIIVMKFADIPRTDAGKAKKPALKDIVLKSRA